MEAIFDQKNFYFFYLAVALVILFLCAFSARKIEAPGISGGFWSIFWPKKAKFLVHGFALT